MDKVSLTIYITAYNEEQNIANLIRSLYKQELISCTLQKIVVLIDGSTDNTNKIVSKLQQRYSSLFHQSYSKNKGKLFRLNQIFKDNMSDILVVLDADIFLVGNTFIEKLISKVISDKNVMISSAHAKIILPKKWREKIIASCFLTWDFIRLSIPKYDSVHNFSSQATAYRNTFAKKLSIPSLATEERIYIYLMAKKENPNGFHYEMTAQIRFFPISTLKDFMLLTKRTFGKKQTVLDTLFGFQTEKILNVRLRYKLLGIVRSFNSYPLLTPIGLFFNFLLPRLILIRKGNNTQQWERSDSTKLNYIYND